MKRLRRMINVWRLLAKSNKDLVCLGDANLCAIKWNEDDYYLKDQAEMVQTFLLETGSSQFVKNYTRSEITSGGGVSRSCIDHCYSNAPGKISTPEVVAVGASDHLGVVVTKYTRADAAKPKVVKKRSYKNFTIENFLNEINSSNINNVITSCTNVEDAALKFETMFRSILDQHAPVKVFQIRKNYAPYLSEQTKKIIEVRNSWKEIAVNNGYKRAENIAKEIGKEIKKAVAQDRKNYFNKDFEYCCD